VSEKQAVIIHIFIVRNQMISKSEMRNETANVAAKNQLGNQDNRYSSGISILGSKGDVILNNTDKINARLA
jgi:hypothetical protein